MPPAPELEIAGVLPKAKGRKPRAERQPPGSPDQCAANRAQVAAIAFSDFAERLVRLAAAATAVSARGAPVNTDALVLGQRIISKPIGALPS